MVSGTAVIRNTRKARGSATETGKKNGTTEVTSGVPRLLVRVATTYAVTPRVAERRLTRFGIAQPTFSRFRYRPGPWSRFWAARITNVAQAVCPGGRAPPNSVQ